MLWNYAEFGISVNSNELSVQYWSGYPQYLFSYLSKGWLIQCVRNNVGMCLWGCASVYVCVSLPLSLSGNFVCYGLQVPTFYWNSSIYNLYLSLSLHAKARLLYVIKWHIACRLSINAHVNMHAHTCTQKYSIYMYEHRAWMSAVCEVWLCNSSM